ncbi:hypothetical protein [Halomicronema hongdechloris]|uniref:hypothetical protein n=1 Tax=Halomicronema hongdechloris TaxID=1209493 RepID=UPI001650F00F|nr:hypothetical protein [Halomicronema hongdechloris]
MVIIQWQRHGECDTDAIATAMTDPQDSTQSSGPSLTGRVKNLWRRTSRGL